MLIGADEGGHDAIHPQLGTFEDFRRFVAALHEHGMEAALDFAIQCSPDHPWVRAHPEWFTRRPDGSWAGTLAAGGASVETEGAAGAGPQAVVVALARLWLAARGPH